MVEEGLSSEAKAFELRLVSVIDAERARLLAIGERHQEFGQLGVGAMRGDEPGDVVAPMPAAPLADDGDRRLADVGQGSGSRRGAWAKWNRNQKECQKRLRRSDARCNLSSYV